MTIRDILCYPDPRLSKVSQPLKVFDEQSDKLIDDMFETMADAEGIGLAAIQIGVPLRIAVIKTEEPIVLINPEITVLEDLMLTEEEGCLSLPGIRANISRPARIKVNAKDKQGNNFKLKADGLLSVCIQHEIDHMDGKLFINKLTPLAKAKIDVPLRNLIALYSEKHKKY
ncbi:MAG: peptide deformylase [Gammaproteobacteria bacterium]|nr:peptide deformylase [Gammaproteobacteria bacterium]